MVFGLVLLVAATLLRVHDYSPWQYHILQFLGCYYLGGRPAYTYASCDKVYNSAKVLHSESDYVLTDEKFYAKGNGHEQHLEWGFFYAIGNHKNVIFLYQNIGVANIILKKWLTQEQLQEFTSFLKDKRYIIK
jgi:secreted trypsin-like serine protease